MPSEDKTTWPFWPWQIWKRYRVLMRDMAVRHARERAALDVWIIECEHRLKEQGL